MKIGPSFDSKRVSALVPNKTDAARPSPSSTPATPAAAVRLSELSTRLADLEARLSGTEAFDQKRIDEIKQAITDGRFSVNSGAVADKLIEHVREMLAGKRA